MHNLVAHIYRRPVQVERAFDNLDRAINPGTKPAWICQNEGFWRLSCFGHSLVSFKRVMSLQSGLRLTACLDNVCFKLVYKQLFRQPCAKSFRNNHVNQTKMDPDPVSHAPARGLRRQLCPCRAVPLWRGFGDGRKPADCRWNGGTALWRESVMRKSG